MEHDRLVAMMRKSLLSPKVIGVLGGKGGVGKTSTVMSVASTLAKYRSGRVVAITLDYNSTLAHRTHAVSDSARGDMSLLDFATDRTLTSPSAISKCFQVNRQGLSVLGTGLNPISRDQLGAAQYTRALKMLKGSFEIIVVDFGNIPNNDVFWASLKSLDALILVTSTENDSIKGIHLAEGVLREAGRDDLLGEQTTMIVNYRSPAAPKADLEKFVGRQQSTEKREVLEMPWDEHLAEAGPVDIELLSKPVQYQYLRAAAIVAASLPS
jgi:MinD-like ATPase involved in chromosome partitioning or flagellar assembly